MKKFKRLITAILAFVMSISSIQLSPTEVHAEEGTIAKLS